jgi:hypothetical protein
MKAPRKGNYTNLKVKYGFSSTDKVTNYQQQVNSKVPIELSSVNLSGSLFPFLAVGAFMGTSNFPALNRTYIKK